MQKKKFRMRTIAAATALTMGLSGCEAFVAEICGPAPAGGDTIPVSEAYS